MLYAQLVEESAMLGNFIDKNLKFNAEKTSASHTANSEVGQMESWPLNKDKMWCTYCKKPRHTREQCRKLHGKPQSSRWNAGPRSEKLRSQVHMTQSKEDMSHGDINFSGGEENEFNKEDIGRLRSLLDSLEKSKGTCSLAHSVKLHSSTKLQGGRLDMLGPINPTLTMPLKVYSRRIKSVINLVQVQETESSLGNEHSASGGVTASIVYVNDIIVTGNDSDEKEALRNYLAKEFEIKDLEKLKYFLGIEVARSKEGIFVSQQKYVLDLLEETGKLHCRPSDTPIEPNHRLAEFMEGEPTDKGMYQRLVGKLIYLSHTRPDIAYAVSGESVHAKH
ncbi:hypothetical protein RJ639_046426 [Escallonia herrerae]|uniref:Reverse transcriptase Ty1/copia-type domain-containing protein n=1 Tax=Escallonia herrerae TaxID=1293975 RepID=A0AA89B0L4_9ASTE|nr:hypothetical protein RJ639_046426 [Escallonia herrerae]